jgi:eukaryotic translation initiation factor 2C
MSASNGFNTETGFAIGPRDNWPITTNKDGVQWLPKVLPERKKLSTLGRPTDVEVNCYDAVFTKFDDPNFKVYQWDVKIEPKTVSRSGKPPKRAFKEILWQSNKVQSTLGRGWLYNGDAIAWYVAQPS